MRGCQPSLCLGLLVLAGGWCAAAGLAAGEPGARVPGAVAAPAPRLCVAREPAAVRPAAGNLRLRGGMLIYKDVGEC